MEASPPTAGRGSWRHWHDDATPLRLGVSTCLLGEQVRFDGGHARDRFVTDALGQWAEWVPVCPEVEVGMPVPRPTIRLVEQDGEVRLVAPSTGADSTEAMRSWSAERVAGLMGTGLDGYVLKKNSPSCGMERLPVYRGEHRLHKQGVGMFAEALMEAWPQLPVEEEGRLNDPVLRENFIVRIFCRNRWRAATARGWSRGQLVDFHTAHKLLLRAHHEQGYRELGRIVADFGQRPDEEIYASYEAAFEATLRHRTSAKANVNVLHHAMGYLKEQLTSAEKQYLLDAIEDYRQRLLPLIVPVSLLRFLIRKFEVEYLLDQIYFDPHPKEMMLRNQG